MPACLDVTTDILREAAFPLTDAPHDYDPLIEMIGESHFVLLGEATHGTHEFYKARADITRRLVLEKGFNAVAVEADWPDAYRVNRFVRGESHDSDAEEALGGFKRFPTWMWRNADVLDFVGWLRGHNDHVPDETKKVGFYGVDLYSLHASIRSVLDYLQKIDPAEAKRARSRYSCFEHYGIDAQAYARSANSSSGESCEEEVISQLVELRRRAGTYSQRNGHLAADEYFFAEQNARLVKNAEEYYRSLFQGRTSTWNLRDQHMAETLDALALHLQEKAQRAKIVVWEHNSHLGDARATQLTQRGELNVGQLMRQKYGDDAVLVGFTTYTGSVTAASDWGEPPERKQIVPALPESYEALFHDAGIKKFFLNLRDDPVIKEHLHPRLERAIGVIYLPESERVSHYFEAHISEQFDAVFHFDETRAVEPLERSTLWPEGEVPETYPTSL